MAPVDAGADVAPQARRAVPEAVEKTSRQCLVRCRRERGKRNPGIVTDWTDQSEAESSDGSISTYPR